jgi:hypothetical protein
MVPGSRLRSGLCPWLLRLKQVQGAFAAAACCCLTGSWPCCWVAGCCRCCLVRQRRLGPAGSAAARHDATHLLLCVAPRAEVVAHVLWQREPEGCGSRRLGGLLLLCLLLCLLRQQNFRPGGLPWSSWSCSILCLAAAWCCCGSFLGLGIACCTCWWTPGYRGPEVQQLCSLLCPATRLLAPLVAPGLL